MFSIKYIFAILLLGCVFCSETYDSAVDKLPFCDNEQNSNELKQLVFVSTLDGRLFALNAANGGEEKWAIPTGPMLSSSIHTLELTNHGQFVRMIPSLSGGLYKFNGQNVEAIPITADNLLKSSFLFSDDVVISGGRESRTFGVDAESGAVLYECSMSKCENSSENSGAGDVVIIQRQTQTVRAIEPRSGAERWNFSVGQHDLKIAHNPASYCESKADLSLADIQLKVIVPDGLVCAMSRSQPGKVIWKHKFENPIVSAWEAFEGKIKWVDLFGGQRSLEDSHLPNSPLLYIGMHNKQLYIQESVNLQRKILESVRNNLLTDGGYLPSIPWRPVSASGYLGIEGPKVVPQIAVEKSEVQTTALSVLYASEYVNGNGFFLFSDSGEKREKATCTERDKLNITITVIPGNESIDEEEEDDGDGIVEIYEEGTPVQIIVSFWYWWKEVLLTSITIAVLLNLIIQRRLILFLRGNRSEDREPLIEGPIFSHSRSNSEGGGQNSSLPGATQQGQVPGATPDYVSRYLTDFEPVHCLGKGGFGVVFQAKNKIDDCHYAIKRIPLPNKEESREKVMREVKALAKLDHQNIVRYFNAWLECPPPNWQEEQDAIWQHTHKCEEGRSDVLVDLSSGLTPTSENPPSLPPLPHNRKSKGGLLKTLWEAASSSLYPAGGGGGGGGSSGGPLGGPEGSSDTSDLLTGGLPLPATSLRGPSHFSELSDSYIVFEGSECPQHDSKDEEERSELSSDEGISRVSCRSTTASLERPGRLELSAGGRSRRRQRSPPPASQQQQSSQQKSSRMYLFIQMQLCKKESLRDWLSEGQQRERREILNIFDQIVQAVEYVHLQGLIHRDLKPSNIFFSPDGQVKVGDFGLVTAMVEGDDFRSPVLGRKVTDENHTARVGTQLYMSPEQVSGQQYNYKVDIFSLGVILFEMMTPFTTQMERWRTLTQVRECKFPTGFDEQFPDEHALLQVMLSQRPEERPTTFGVRGRPPLRELQPDSLTPAEWEYSLPPARHRGHSLSRSSQDSS